MAIDLNNPNNLNHDKLDRDKVYFYRYLEYKSTDYYEITHRCPQHAEQDEAQLELIGQAGDWDECLECGIQNVPHWYSEQYDYHGDLLKYYT